MMSQSRSSSVVALALLFTLVAAPRPTAAFRSSDPILAQSSVSEFPIPDSIPTGTTVRIDGSNSMSAINQSLKQRMETDYAGTNVELSYGGTPAALQALLDGEIDLAAIGRSLTEEERAQGFLDAPVGRHKIAIIVGEDNPFDGNLTFEQFARIFRGEITDWSEVGGEPGPIRLVDHPETGDTRQTLSFYDIFQTAPFETGDTAEQLEDDSVEAITANLGRDGISYITANQVFNRPGVKIIPMHGTLPDDPRYPYSQPMSYVYRDADSPIVAAFLGFATSATGISAIQDAGIVAAQPGGTGTVPGTAVPPAPGTTDSTVDPAADPTTDAETVVPPATGNGAAADDPAAAQQPAPGTAPAEDDRGVPGWLWWLIPLLIGIPLLGWLLGKGRQTEPTAGAMPPASPATPPVVPPEVPPVVPPPAAPLPAEPPSGTLAERAGTVISADRTSIAAAASPAQANLNPAVVGGAALAGAGAIAGGIAAAKFAQPNRIVLVPRTSDQAYAYWEVPEENQAALREQGGNRYALRIYDATGIAPEQVTTDNFQKEFQEYQCAETEQDRHVPIPQTDRDYVAEIGYLTDDNEWLLLARSNPVHVPATRISTEAEPKTTLQPEPTTLQPKTPSSLSPAAIGVGVAATATAAAAAIPPREPKPNRIVLVPRTLEQAYAYWEVPEENKADLRRQGGQQYTLRICDVTGIDLEQQAPHMVQQYSCDEADVDRHVPIPQVNRDYVAEIGYLTDRKEWLLLARSSPVYVPDATRETIIEDTPPVIATPNGDQEIVEAAKFNVGQTDLRGEELADVDAFLPDLPDGYGESQIVLLPRDPHWAYTYWDVPSSHREAVRQQGGTRLALRFYDVTSVNLDYQNPHSLQQYDCEEFARDWYLPVPVSDRDYIVEIGYLTPDGRWLMMARSAPVRIPPVYPSDWLEEQYLNVDWNDNLREREVHKLVPPDQRTSFENPIYDRIFSMAQSAEAQRLAGSLYGSMQQVPQQAVSSYAFPSGIGMSGVGMSGVPTMSGVGMSGVGMYSMSGVGMGIPTLSGVGMMSGVGVYSMSGIGMMSGMGMYSMSGVGMSGMGMMGVPTMSGVGMSGVGMYSMSGVGMGIPTLSGVGMMSGIGMYSMSGVGMSGVGMSGVGMSGVGMSGVGMSGVRMSIPTMSGVGMSGVGMYSMSGVGMSGVGIYSMSGVGMSGVGMSVPTMSGVGMSGVGMSVPTMSGFGMSVPTMSGIGMSGVGMSVPTMSGVGMSGVGMSVPTMSGVGMSGVGMSVPTMSGFGMSVPTMSGIGMSGVGMSVPTMSGVGMSGVGMSVPTMSGVGMSGVGIAASMPPIRPRKFWLIANAELIVHGATEPDATLMVGDRLVQLDSDGTFRFQVAFPDGDINYPILAIAADREQNRSIRMDFNRVTPVQYVNTKEEAIEEWLQG